MNAEQLGFYKKSTYQNIQAEQKTGCFCNALYFKKQRIPICLFDKNHIQNNIKCHTQHEES